MRRIGSSVQTDRDSDLANLLAAFRRDRDNMKHAIRYLEKLVQFREEMIADNRPQRQESKERVRTAGAGDSGMELVS